MEKKKNIFSKEPIIHIVFWLIVVIFNFIVTDDVDFDKELSRTLPARIGYIVLFYLNYLVLIPRLLFRKKNAMYIVISVAVISFMFVGLRTVDLRKRVEFYQELLEKNDGNPVVIHPGAPKMSNKQIMRRIESGYALDQYNPFTRKLPNVQFYGLLLIFSLSMVLRFIVRWREQEQEQMELEKERMSSELDYLKQQINPHFLFNAINSIYSLTLPHEDTRASESILKLSAILRYMLYETNQKLVLLEREIEIIEDYIGLHRLRLTSKTQVNLVVNGNLSGYGIEPLLLIPFIENAFKYGIDSSEACTIDISIDCTDNYLKFGVVNKILVKNNAGKHSGIGIKNIERRLEILYPDSHNLDIKQVNDNFIVSLNLPLKRI